MGELKNLTHPETFGSVISADANADIKEKKSAIKLDRIVPLSAIIMDLEAEDSFSAIKEIVNKLAESHLLRDKDTCRDDLLKREQISSTCIPGGIALPHARSTGVSRMVSAIAISKKGVAASDGSNEKTNIFVLTLSPIGSDQPYLQYISQISRALMKEKTTELILNAKTPAELRDVFLHNA
jgi:mannitol/fructose-specific phosphotransferase system IIA component (Ntr-type)